MPGEAIDRPSVPDYVSELLVKVEKQPLPDNTNDVVAKFRRAANYIAAAMIFFQNNVYLERDLKHEDIKPRLLGHWGTCPGLALVYAHLNLLIKKTDLDMLSVVGPGHGAPAILVALWLEAHYPILPSTTGGFPSHISAVLPIVHVDGFKISERTIYGCMDNKELAALFTGYGYQPRVVDDLDDIDVDLSNSMEWALGEVRRIQKAAREGKPITKPRWPMLILRTPKGWSGPKEVHGTIVEGYYKAHQVPLPQAKTDAEELKQLQQWLESYKPKELFKENGDVIDEIKSIVPTNPGRRLGQKKEVSGAYRGLQVIDWRKFTVEKGSAESSMKAVGRLLEQVVKDNPKTFRIFSPDEFGSKKLDTVLNSTNRNFQWDQFSQAQGGRVIEVLSEHQCQGWMQVA
ncbi:hypothetical protein PV04_04453 [Phialophora macrospora]|uniref:Xylulose 5-phosphate/Fructose 6-phosphate phosphoketolase N-terminal domain-containing protein n=1 Tax=Phialophora macrospora TaxID=1851006 RepID=A0A0D2FK94_9EURO|nr:hypothetical protein PV04_04453 [Phialophora macrospora]